MYEGVDTVVLYDELAYQDCAPIGWQALPEPLPKEVLGQMTDRNLRLLQACTALEEHGQVEKQDENSPHAADIIRLDMKMNLLLDLVGRLLIASQPRPQPTPVRFNARGAIFKRSESMPAASLELGTEGIFEIHLKDCLVEPLRLIGRVANIAPDGRVKVKFSHPGDGIANLIEKLAFRRHRRQVADAKNPRDGQRGTTARK